MPLTPTSLTVTEILTKAETNPRFGARFMDLAGREQFFPYPEVVRRARASAALFQRKGLQPGDRVALVLRTSITLFDALLGVQLAGGIPTALYPPFRLGRLDEYFQRLERMLTKVGARYVVSDSQIGRILGPGVAGAPSVEDLITADELAENGNPEQWSPVMVAPDTPAFLQFSSGTTVEPKAVMISHRNLVENLEMMKTALGPRSDEDQERGAVCWLPLYHDMGLVGNLYLGLYYPGTVTYMGPELFVGKPAMWLRAISRHRAVISAAPNFAYGLCVSKIRDEELNDVDLSCWRMALNGAEPIDVRTLEMFAGRFAKWGFRKEALMPVYGLAEAGLGVSFSPPGKGPRITSFDRDTLAVEGRAVPGEGRPIVSVGRPMRGLEVQIRDPENQPLPEGRVGRIVIRGPSITSGYYADPELTAEVVYDGWLDTGDLGFLHDGDLYISGRGKDLIIIRGRNYSPQEIEELLVDIEGLRLGCAVALGTIVEDEGERLIILAERDSLSNRPDEEVVAEVRAKVIAGCSLVPYDIELLEPGTLPRTSSGKLRRSDALRQFLAGELAPPDKVTALKLLKDLGKSQVSWAKFRINRRRK